MPSSPGPDAGSIPTDSKIFGYGPMLPFIAAALGAWILPTPWPHIATEFAIIWGALILGFVAGVRRGYGFGAAGASTRRAILTMLAYFVPAGLALILLRVDSGSASLLLLAFGFGLVILLDRRGARSGDAPPHFARLRGPQMSLAVISLLALAARPLIAS